jgi:hypothetical protein
MGSDGLNEQEMMIIFLGLILVIALFWVAVNKGWSIDGIFDFYNKMAGSFSGFG